MDKSPEKKSKLSSISVAASGSKHEYQRYHSPQLQPCEPFYELSKKRRVSPNLVSFGQIDSTAETNDFEFQIKSNHDQDASDMRHHANIIVPEYPPSALNNPESISNYPNRMRLVLSSGENLNQRGENIRIRKVQSTNFNLSDLNFSGEATLEDLSEKPTQSIRTRYIKKKKSDL
ncbi:unnamed protein product [Blepharisma stoltei]|uniref:Uncharacterized protein n=1 Tax=Blepharisma stoltei TaxID=1481888 RepID=A0AAU9JGM6_9CILI|nr:unnamed protein product [Blepharisma stoltei]